LVKKQAATGYRPKARTRRIVADQERWPDALETLWPMWPEEGAEPFWADIRENLTFADLDHIPVTGATFADQWKAIAPWVVAWNAMALDPGTGEWEPVPPPAEAGPDALKTQPSSVTAFIVLCLKNGLGTDVPKGRKRSDDTDATASDEN
jgi:hypothetical protein